MRVFGIGLPKTGTQSVCAALNMLGIKSIHNPVDSVTIGQLKLGDYRLSILDRCEAIFDLPAACFYRDFDHAYPGSKFILTTREKDTWLRSCKNWWRIRGLNSLEGIDQYERQSGNSMIYLKARMFGCIGFNERVFSRVHDEWDASVHSHFAQRPEDLCVLPVEAVDKWARLCRFLNKPVPDIEFPHLNHLVRD
jgi:Sulfotransferase domain